MIDRETERVDVKIFNLEKISKFELPSMLKKIRINRLVFKKKRILTWSQIERRIEIKPIYFLLSISAGSDLLITMHLFCRLAPYTFNVELLLQENIFRYLQNHVARFRDRSMFKVA